MTHRPTSPAFKLGTDHRRPLNGEGVGTPGPGSYTHKSTNYGPNLSFKGVVSKDAIEKEQKHDLCHPCVSFCCSSK